MNGKAPRSTFVSFQTLTSPKGTCSPKPFSPRDPPSAAPRRDPLNVFRERLEVDNVPWMEKVLEEEGMDSKGLMAEKNRT